MSVGYSTGTFDLPHIGHFRLLKYMKQRCDFLIIGLTTDEIAKKQKRVPYLPYEQRFCILEHSKYVDAVVAHTGETKADAWYKLKFDVLFIGDDYFDSDEYKNFEKEFPDIPVHYVPRTLGVSTSDLIKLLEHRSMLDLQIQDMGISGPVLSMHNGKIIAKSVNVGRTEYLKKNSLERTADVYHLPLPRPRNWKRKGRILEFPNIPGVNAFREIDIHQFIKGKKWNPVIHIKEGYTSKYVQQIVKKGQSNIEKIVSERKFPASIFLIFQKNGGQTFANYLDSAGQNIHTIKFVVNEVWSIIKELRQLNILHMDIHPGNILMDENKNISLIDFGWTEHVSFYMSSEELKLYRKQLNENFDWFHFVHSMVLYKIDAQKLMTEN